MDPIQKLMLDIKGIELEIKAATPDGVVTEALKNIKRCFDKNDVDGINYSLKKILRWYEHNKAEIQANEYILNKAILQDIMQDIGQIQKELDMVDNNKLKIEKGSVLHTAFDSYTVVMQIGQGGNGRVFEVKNSLNEKFAVKIIDRENTSSEKVRRFKNEINFCQSIDHPNIIKVLDYGTAFNNKYLFYVMPLFKETLRSRINAGISHENIEEIVINILNGLEFAHEMKIYHRDIKPENILFKDGGNSCVIADFGIAHFPENDCITKVETKLNSRMANFQYAAPEQRMVGKKIDGRADVYAVALILNEMFTGELIAGGDYKKIKEVDPEYAYLDEIVENLHLQDPEKRFYPVNKIKMEMRVRKHIQDNDLAIKTIENIMENDAVESDESLEAPVIIESFFEDRTLNFILNKNMPAGWFSILKAGKFSHRAFNKYDTERWDGCCNALFVPMDGNVDKSTLEQIIHYLNEWICDTTICYNKEEAYMREQKQREKEEALRKNILEKKAENTINDMLSSLI